MSIPTTVNKIDESADSRDEEVRVHIGVLQHGNSAPKFTRYMFNTLNVDQFSPILRSEVSTSEELVFV